MFNVLCPQSQLFFTKKSSSIQQFLLERLNTPLHATCNAFRHKIL